MAFFEEEFRLIVLTVPKVIALIDDRLCPIILRPNETLPAATYRRTGTRYEVEVDDSQENAFIEFPTIELTLWGFAYDAMREAMEDLKAALRTTTLFAHTWHASITAEEDTFDRDFQHADGIGVPGMRLECQFVKFA